MASQKRNGVIMVVVTIAFCLGAVIYATGYYPGGYSWPGPGSRQNPLPVNATITYSPSSVTYGIIDMYHYTKFDGYTLNVTLLEIIKGEEANRLMAREGEHPMSPGYNFLMARFRVHVLEDSVKILTAISSLDFTATDSTGKVFYPMTYACYEPFFGADHLNKGDIVEGWVVTEYDKRETAPLIVFDHYRTNSIGLWFKTTQ